MSVSPRAAKASDAGGTSVDERDFNGRGHSRIYSTKMSSRGITTPLPYARIIAGLSGFFTLIQSRDRPDL
jgi:hypothetical protein